MVKKLKKKHVRKTNCADCRYCFMIIHDPCSVVSKRVACKKVPESLVYHVSHYEGTYIPKYCSMFEDKQEDQVYVQFKEQQ